MYHSFTAGYVIYAHTHTHTHTYTHLTFFLPMHIHLECPIYRVHCVHCTVSCLIIFCTWTANKHTLSKGWGQCHRMTARGRQGCVLPNVAPSRQDVVSSGQQQQHFMCIYRASRPVVILAALIKCRVKILRCRGSYKNGLLAVIDIECFVERLGLCVCV